MIICNCNYYFTFKTKVFVFKKYFVQTVHLFKFVGSIYIFRVHISQKKFGHTELELPYLEAEDERGSTGLGTTKRAPSLPSLRPRASSVVKVLHSRPLLARLFSLNRPPKIITFWLHNFIGVTTILLMGKVKSKILQDIFKLGLLLKNSVKLKEMKKLI